MVASGGMLVVAGGAASVFGIGIPAGLPTIAYGIYSLHGGIITMQRGGDQISTCISEREMNPADQTIGANVGRFARGLAPDWSKGYIHGYGGSVW
jgi:hypothetical protein